MGRSKNSGMVWRPIEYALLACLIFLIILLLWAIREIDRQDARVVTDSTQLAEVDDSDISSIVEQGIRAETAVDAAYDVWEERSTSVVDSAADDIGGVYDESAY